MQHTVENTWRSNVAALAEQVDAEVRRTGARVLVLAGDGQSRELLRDALAERSASIAVDVEHSGRPLRRRRRGAGERRQGGRS